MKRLNLLPVELQPRSGNARASSYAVLGTLLALTIAMIGYAFVQAGASSRADEIKGLQEETEVAKADASALGPYAEFAAMKDARARSVRGVAEMRFDYERLTRELTRILPERVYVPGMDVAPPDDDLAAGADSAEAMEAASGLSVSLAGCAPNQPTVADTLDRLAALTGATGVELGASGDGAAPAGAGGDGFEGANAGACTGGVSFQATVALAPPAPEGAGL